MCLSSTVSYTKCGCKIKTPPSPCHSAQNHPTFWRRQMNKVRPTCKAVHFKNMYVHGWCHACGNAAPEDRRAREEDWEEEKVRRQGVTNRLPMPACGATTEDPRVRHPANSLLPWQQRIIFEQNQKNKLVMLRCDICNRPPFLKYENLSSKKGFQCCNKRCQRVEWEDWQGFADLPSSPKSEARVDMHYPGGIYLRYHTNDGMVEVSQREMYMRGLRDFQRTAIFEKGQADQALQAYRRNKAYRAAATRLRQEALPQDKRVLKISLPSDRKLRHGPLELDPSSTANWLKFRAVGVN